MICLHTKLENTLYSLRKYELYYNGFMAFLAISIVILMILDTKDVIPESMDPLLNIFDKSIWGIFVVDYFTRLFISKDKFLFVRNNIVDLIAILPFNMLFQGFRAARILRLIYMLRAFAYLNRAYNELCMVLKTNHFNHILWFTFCTIFVGAISISYVDDMDIGDAFWWSFVTTTTVGYGDIAPQSFGGRIIAVFLMLVGIGFLSSLTGTISTFFIQKTESLASYKDEEVALAINQLNHFDDLSINDLNHMHHVLVMLKEKTHL